jgi:hypothetical protein
VVRRVKEDALTLRIVRVPKENTCESAYLRNGVTRHSYHQLLASNARGRVRQSVDILHVLLNTGTLAE